MKRFNHITIVEFAKQLDNFFEAHNNLADILTIEKIGSIIIDNDRFELINARVIDTDEYTLMNTICQEMTLDIVVMHKSCQFYSFQLIYQSNHMQVIDLGNEDYVLLDNDTQYRLEEELPDNVFGYCEEGESFFREKLIEMVKELVECSGVEFDDIDNIDEDTLITCEIHSDEIYIDNWEEMFEL